MDKTWTTEQLREEFEVMGFSMGHVVVRRKADGVVGSMLFKAGRNGTSTGISPRVYFDWHEH